MQYLAKSPRLDFNSCLWDNLNNGRILPPPPPRVSLSPTQVMAPLQVIPILVKWKIRLFRSPTYGLLVGAIFGQGPPGLTSIMAQGITRIMAAFCPLQRLFESNSNNGPAPGHSNLTTLKKITTACTITALLISLYFTIFHYFSLFTEHVSNIIDKAQKCLYALLAKNRKWKGFKSKLLLYPFDHTISQILSYGCEIWGNQDWDIIKKLHLFICKFSLGVKASTPTDGVYAELGRYPLKILRHIQMIKFALRV